MKINPLYLVVVLIIISLIPIVYSISASVSNAKIIIETNVDEGDSKVITRTLTYNNRNDIGVIVTLSLSGDLVYVGELEDYELEIEAGGSENVELTIYIDQPGLYEGNVNAVYSEVGAGSGIGISSEIIVSASGDGEMWESPDGYINDDEEIVESVENEEEDDEESGGSVSFGGNANTNIKEITSNNKETKKEENGPDFIEKYFHGNLLAFFIVLILMAVIGLEIFYVVYRITKRY